MFEKLSFWNFVVVSSVVHIKFDNVISVFAYLYNELNVIFVIYYYSDSVHLWCGGSSRGDHPGRVLRAVRAPAGDGLISGTRRPQVHPSCHAQVGALLDC